ncbi:sensor histidine kinase [Microcoleus sp. B7-D4]|uniref:sensor histidine kinase n=1 Tax=Microcoleus sp. B7-D4 TaxID=2818696 RepID=UPI002FD526C1
MNGLLKFQPQPFRFLLYTEWMMLLSCGSFAVLEAIEEQHLPFQHILILGLLGGMGLMLPKSPTPLKLLYTCIEIALIFYGATLGYLHILPTLYVIVLIRSCFLFEQLGRWAIACLSLFLFLVHQVRYVQNTVLLVSEGQYQFWMHLIAETIMFALGLFLALKLVNTLISERKIMSELAIAHEQLRQYARQAEDLAEVRERNRIAMEIHDSLGHAVTALNVQLQAAIKLWQRNPERAQIFLEQAQKLGTTAMKEMRKSVSALREDREENETLESAITSLVKNSFEGTGISISTNISLNTSLPPHLVKAIYRIVQESLTNICKHAKAKEVEIKLSTTKDYLYLTVQDNGKGFSLNQNTAGFGIHSMQERVSAIGGKIQIETSPAAGCRIFVEIPIGEMLV